MGNSNGITTILLVSLKMMDLRNDLCSLRPSNFYPPRGFYPTGSHDVFWTSNEDLFLKRFRFRLPHFHRLMTAMKLDGEYFACDTGKKYPADVCMMVLLRRLSYPCTFWQLATEFLCDGMMALAGPFSWKRQRPTRCLSLGEVPRFIGAEIYSLASLART